MAIKNLRELAIVNGLVEEYKKTVTDVYFRYCDDLPPSGVTYDEVGIVMGIIDDINRAWGIYWSSEVVGKNLGIDIMVLLREAEEEIRKEHHEDADLSKIYTSMTATIDEFCRTGRED